MNSIPTRLGTPKVLRWVLILLAPCVLVVTGCGGGTTGPLHVTTTASFVQGPILVRHITYTTFDGTRVPALFSIPRGASPRGCLIWEDGFGGTKEGTERFWGGAARLGLAMFAIDLRDHGQRATSPSERFRAERSPLFLKALVSGTVKDLQRAVDYLWTQPVCRHNIGYVGLSLGGMIGAVVAGQDTRVRTVALLSVPPSYRAVIEATNRDCLARRECQMILLPGITHHPGQLSSAVRLLAPLDPDRWIGKISPRPLLLTFGVHDPLVPPSSAAVTAASAGEPKTVVHYNGGHIPFLGAAARSTAGDIGLFFLTHLVEPSYGANLPKVTP